MPSEHDDDIPLAGLRAAWRGVTPPPLADASEQADPATRATVDWMRAAFAALEVPAAPVKRLPRGRRHWLRFPAPQVCAAAAAVLIALGAWWGTHRDAPAEGFAPERVADPRGPGPEPGSSEAGSPGLPQVAALGPDRIELRSGPVRLILMQPTAGSND